MPAMNARLRRAAIAAFSVATVVSATIAPAAAAQTWQAPLAPYERAIHRVNPHLAQSQTQAYATAVLDESYRLHLDPRFVMAIVTVESAWRPDAVSRVGARGLGQLMPETASGLHVNAWSGLQNIKGTTSYLAQLVKRFKNAPQHFSWAIGAYNAGPQAVAKYQGIPPYAETQQYVKKVLHAWSTLNRRIAAGLLPHAMTQHLALSGAIPEPDLLWNVPKTTLSAVAAAVDADAAADDAKAKAAADAPATTTAPQQQP
jgi:soluble lytic murein transglycosylase-like protein